MAYEFSKHLRTSTNYDKINAGIKCLGIAYVALVCTDHEKYHASVLLTIMCDEAEKRILHLELTGELVGEL